jgi:tetratricopeptide (TPR) repeat protein
LQHLLVVVGVQLGVCGSYIVGRLNSGFDNSGDSAARAIDDALVHHRAGRLGEAEAIYRQVLARTPTHANALHLLGVVQGQRGQPLAAIELIGRAIAIRGDVADYHANLGEYLRHAGRLEESGVSFRRAIEMRGDDAGFHNGLGVTLIESREIEAAIGEFQTAVGLSGDHAQARNNLAGVLREAGRLDEALAEVKRAIELQPGMFAAYNHLGLVLFDQGKYPEAIEAYLHAIALKPDYAKAHTNLSQAYLVLGDYPRGWEEYEWRVGVASIVGTRKFDRPRWDGKEAAGKTIFVHTEQGFGDMIQFVRFVPELIRRGARVILESPAELARIFQGFGEVLKPGTVIPAHDVHCPLLSLAGIFGVRVESIPAPIPYLKAEAGLVEQWKRRFDAGDKRMRVGIVWGGRATHTNDRKRSMKLRQFGPLASVRRAAFYSLQKGAASASTPPPGLVLTDWTSELGDFADTAALVENLDLLITADTAVAHLAGAMGKRVWVLVPKAPDWRWMLEREDSPWYPTMRLFRQKSAGDWDEVFERVREELEKASMA